jgi:hypothetical protein
MTGESAPVDDSKGLGEQLTVGLPSTGVRSKAAVEPSLQVQMPARLVKQLKMAAIEKETSVRVIVLEALKAQGFDVGEIRDRRRGG